MLPSRRPERPAASDGTNLAGIDGEVDVTKPINLDL